MQFQNKLQKTAETTYLEAKKQQRRYWFKIAEDTIDFSKAKAQNEK